MERFICILTFLKILPLSFFLEQETPIFRDKEIIN